jgi:hypothetical protein
VLPYFIQAEPSRLALNVPATCAKTGQVALAKTNCDLVERRAPVFVRDADER